MRYLLLVLALNGCTPVYPETKINHAAHNMDVVELYAGPEFYVYKFVDGDNTCYVSQYGAAGISCTKNK